MHPDALGWTAAALMVATFSCREARHLRPLAVATNLAFIGYGLTAALLPVLVLHAALLPINLWHWWQSAGASPRLRRWRAWSVLAPLVLLSGCGSDGKAMPGPEPGPPPLRGAP